MKQIVNRLLTRLAGVKLTHANRRFTLADAAAFLSAQGVVPALVIDIGVAWGTEELYAAFPSAKLLLVEPNKDWQPTLNKLIARRGGKSFVAAAGATSGEIVLNVWGEHPGCSTVRPTIEREEVFTRRDRVPVLPLDAMVAETGIDGRAVLKIDVQGAELDVLLGATETLKRCDAVIIETSTFGGGKGPEIADVVRVMSDLGFSVYDIVGVCLRPFDRALAQLDMVFVPTHGPLRASHRWE